MRNSRKGSIYRMLFENYKRMEYYKIRPLRSGEGTVRFAFPTRLGHIIRLFHSKWILDERFYKWHREPLKAFDKTIPTSSALYYDPLGKGEREDLLRRKEFIIQFLELLKDIGLVEPPEWRVSHNRPGGPGGALLAVYYEGGWEIVDCTQEMIRNFGVFDENQVNEILQKARAAWEELRPRLEDYSERAKIYWREWGKLLAWEAELHERMWPTPTLDEWEEYERMYPTPTLDEWEE